jgi:DNA repair exonuclease SbcCD ATPase subunit
MKTSFFFLVGILASTLLGLVGCSNRVESKTEELARCEEAKKTAVAELEICQQKTAADLAIVARNLESMLQSPEQQPGAIEGGPPVTVAISPKMDESLLKIQALTPLIVARFSELQTLINKRFDGQQRAVDIRDKQIQDQLQNIEAQTAEQQVSAAQMGEMRERAEELKNEHRRHKEKILSQLEQLEKTLEQFDSEKLNCPNCGKGFTGKFARELLSFHGQLLRDLQDLKREAHGESD